MTKILLRQFSGHFSPSFSCFATSRLRLLLPESFDGLTRNDKNSHVGKAKEIRKLSQCFGRLVRYHTVTVTANIYIYI
jgi:hypothetical protein